MTNKPNRARALEIMATLRPPGADSVSIKIDGPIDARMAYRVRTTLRGARDATDLNVFVNSPGGDLPDGFAIFDEIRAHRAERKFSYGYGEVASAAALVFVAADVRRLYPSTRVLLHRTEVDPIGQDRWTSTAYGATAERLAAIDRGVALTIAERLGVAENIVVAEMGDERPMPLPKCLSTSFAHEIVGVSEPLSRAWPDKARAAMRGFDCRMYGAGAYRFSTSYLNACAIGGK